MTLRKLTLAFFVSTLMIGAAVAECTTWGCADVYVEQLYVSSASGFYVRTSGNELLANCTPDSGIFLYVPNTSSQMKEVYATLLAAQLADKRVNIRVNEGTSPCTVAYVTLDRQ